MAELATVLSPSASVPRLGDRLARRVVLARLERLEHGRLWLREPDGSVTAYGAPDGEPSAALNVRSWRFFSRIATGGDIGAGESYMDGDWSSPDLVGLVRLFLANEAVLDRPTAAGSAARLADRLLHLARRNTRAGSRRNVRAHYDLGNDFYDLFLDETMTYSAAVFAAPGEDLAAAQRRKLLLMAEKAGLRPGDHVLEIGCGWGGFAELAATELGCRVTGVTLSQEQAAFARERMRRAGVVERVEILVTDYRDLSGSYDAIVSIEMLEAVGHEYLDDFFAACERLLAPGGRAALQVITIPDQIYDRYRRSTDWIRKHVFPGGHLPSLQAMQDAIARRTSLIVDDVENIGIHYAETLRRWRGAFLRRLDAARGLGFDDRFLRMWEFYLASCEAAFAHRKLADLQLVLARPGQTRGEPGPAVYGGRP